MSEFDRTIRWWEFGLRRDARALDTLGTTPPDDERERRRWKKDRKHLEWLLFPGGGRCGDPFGFAWAKVEAENNVMGVWQ